MKLIEVPLVTPKRLRSSQFARNGIAPSAAADSLLATQLNHLVRNKRKLLFAHGILESQLPAGGAGTGERLRFRFMTGFGAVGVRVRAEVMARTYSGTTVPKLKLDLYDIVGASTVTTYVNLPSVPPAAFGVNELAHLDQVIDATEMTEYILTISDVDGTRILSACGVDVAATPSDDATCYLSAVSSVGKPITAARHNAMRDTINKLYKYNGPQLLSWSTHTGAETITTNSTTYARVFQTGNDFRFDLSNMARRNQTTVPVVFAAMGSWLGAYNADVALFEGATNKGSVNLTSTNGWVSTTFNLAASDLTYSLKFKTSSALSTLTLKAACCYVYDP